MEFGLLDFDKAKAPSFSFIFGRKKIFIIHGHDLKNVDCLEKMLWEFNLKPILLSTHYEFGASTIIEKFEEIGARCKYAIAICTPDDLVIKNEMKYTQPRQNVIYEIGWFCAKISRKKVLLLVKEGTEIFSDFQGVRRVPFKGSVDECYKMLHKAIEKII